MCRGSKTNFGFSCFDSSITPVFLAILAERRSENEWVESDIGIIGCLAFDASAQVAELCSLPLGLKVDILPAEVLGMLVQPSVFKTDVGREKRLGGVRFPCISAKIFPKVWESHPAGFAGKLCSTV